MSIEKRSKNNIPAVAAGTIAIISGVLSLFAFLMANPNHTRFLQLLLITLIHITTVVVAIWRGRTRARWALLLLTAPCVLGLGFETFVHVVFILNL